MPSSPVTPMELPEPRPEYQVRMGSLHSAKSQIVGDALEGCSCPLPTLEAAALRAYSMMPQLVTQHVESTDRKRSDLWLEVFRVSDGAPHFRVCFHNLGTPPPTRRFDVVLCNWKDEERPRPF